MSKLTSMNKFQKKVKPGKQRNKGIEVTPIPLGVDTPQGEYFPIQPLEYHIKVDGKGATVLMAGIFAKCDVKKQENGTIEIIPCDPPILTSAMMPVSRMTFPNPLIIPAGQIPPAGSIH